MLTKDCWEPSILIYYWEKDSIKIIRIYHPTSRNFDCIYPVKQKLKNKLKLNSVNLVDARYKLHFSHFPC